MYGEVCLTRWLGLSVMGVGHGRRLMYLVGEEIVGYFGIMQHSSRQVHFEVTNVKAPL